MAGAHQRGGIVDQQGGVVRLEAERGFVIALGLRKVAVIGFVLAGEEVGGGSEFWIGCLSQARECIAIDFAVANDFFGYVGFVVEGRHGWSDVRDIGRCYGRWPRTGVHGGDASRLYALDRGFRDGVSVFAEVILDAVFVLADLVGPDNPS